MAGGALEVSTKKGEGIRIPISVAVITRNEEDRLSGCLESLNFVDEVLVVDSGSTDRTVERAKEHGAKVIVEEWRGFSNQKQLAVDLCRNDWVLILDADERLPPETLVAIRQEMARLSLVETAFSFRRKNYLHGRWVKHCGWWPDRVVRLVDRRHGRLDGRPVHERWLTDGRVGHLDACIEHNSFQNYSHLVEKMQHYSDLASREMFERKAKAGAIAAFSHGLWMFWKTYLLDLGFLEGVDGLVISIMNAGGSFLKYAKLREMWKSGG